MITLQKLGLKLKNLREQFGFSQEFVAKELGLKRQAIIAIEAGKRNLDSFELFKLGSLFGVEIKSLLKNSELIESPKFTEAVLHLRKNGQLSEMDKKHLIEFQKICEDFEFLKGLSV